MAFSTSYSRHLTTLELQPTVMVDGQWKQSPPCLMLLERIPFKEHSLVSAMIDPATF